MKCWRRARCLQLCVSLKRKSALHNCTLPSVGTFSCNTCPQLPPLPRTHGTAQVLVNSTHDSRWRSHFRRPWSYFRSGTSDTRWCRRIRCTVPRDTGRSSCRRSRSRDRSLRTTDDERGASQRNTGSYPRVERPNNHQVGALRPLGKPEVVRLHRLLYPPNSRALRPWIHENQSRVENLPGHPSLQSRKIPR